MPSFPPNPPNPHTHTQAHILTLLFEANCNPTHNKPSAPPVHACHRTYGDNERRRRRVGEVGEIGPGLIQATFKKNMVEQLYTHLNTAVARASEGRREREREKERRERIAEER